ncbi:MAG: chemotaxis protein CheC [Nanoarchaeota archaeon]
MELTDYQKDIFKEIGNVGIGTGATALSQMISRDVNITFPNVQLINVDEIFSKNEEYCVSSCKLQGDLDGCIISVFDKKNAFNLIDLMFFREKGTTTEIDEDGKGAYNEMLNVVGGCYLNSLADMINIKLMPMPPVFVAGPLINIKDSVLQQLNDVNDSFFIKTDFNIGGETIEGNIFLILTNESNKKVLDIIDKMN